ncbi:hypothetical protein AB1Y20_017603 [Prymnesium parvum]|uniref:Uncharacterized protein n=1 Tax=Prymnesium parvum TaxID=97485 RepID=A0AB34JL04_PRYPA
MASAAFAASCYVPRRASTPSFIGTSSLSAVAYLLTDSALNPAKLFTRPVSTLHRSFSHRLVIVQRAHLAVGSLLPPFARRHHAPVMPRLLPLPHAPLRLGVRHGRRALHLRTPEKQPQHKTLVTCSPGLEDMVREELRGLQVRRSRHIEMGTIEAEMSTQQLYAANALLRGATRVLVNVCQFRAASFPEMECAFKARRRALAPFLPPGVDVSIKVHSRKSVLYHTDAIAQRLRAWILEEFPKADAPSSEVLLTAFVDRDHFTIRVDTSGEPLYKRSWHVSGAQMPMRQSVAAGILRSVGWREAASIPLLDPLCGSGTLPIEAALISLGLPPHQIESIHPDVPGRVFAFQAWPSFDARCWGGVHAEVQRREHAAIARRASTPPVLAADLDAKAVGIATEQAHRAGVGDIIEIRQGCMSDSLPPIRPHANTDGDSPPPHGILVTNLPWGIRSASDTSLRQLYGSFGNLYRKHFSSWNVGVLLEQPKLAHLVDPSMSLALRLRSGDIDCRLMTRCH